MDIHDFLVNGVTVPNPNYKKPSKSNPAGSPKFIRDDDFNHASDYGSKIGNILSGNSYDLTELDNNRNRYGEYNVHVNPVNTEEELQNERARNQSAAEQVGHMLMQAGVNEVLLGTALGFSNMWDMIANLTKAKGDDDYTNPVSQYLEELQDSVRERFDIYQKDPSQSWAMGDWGWWTSNAVSVASTASMLLPSTGIVKGVGLLGRGLSAATKGTIRFNKVNKGIAKAINGARGVKATDVFKAPFSKASRINLLDDFAEGAKTYGKLARRIGSGIEIGSTALLSRTMENYMEARQNYRDIYDDTLNRIKNMSDEERATLLKNNPQFADKTNEEIARYIASVSADETFINDYWMLAFDIPQFKAINALWKRSSGVTKASQRIANRNAARELAGETLEKTGFLANQKEALRYALQNPFNSHAFAELGEGVEEGFQGIQTEKGKEVAEKILNPSFSPRSIESYLTDGKIWEQAFWGWIGGLAFQGIGEGIGNAYRKIDGLYKKKNLSEEDYNKAMMTADKVMKAEIDSRKELAQTYVENMQLLNAGQNPFKFKIDSVTKKRIVVDGNEVHETLTADEADELKRQLTDDFITELVLNATDVGNYDLLKEYLKDPAFNKYFKEKGINAGVDQEMSDYILNRADKIYEDYSTALSNVFDNVDVENTSIAQAVARQIVRTGLYKENNVMARLNVRDKLQQLRLQQGTDTMPWLDDYIEQETYAYIQRELAELDKNEKEVRELYHNKKISKAAHDKYLEDFNERRLQLLQSRENTAFGSLDTVKAASALGLPNRLVAEFNKFMADNANLFGQKRAKFTPTNEVKSNVQKLIQLQDEYSRYKTPVSKREYQEWYDEFTEALDKRAKDKYLNAIDNITKYIESRDDLTNVVQDLITNNVPDNLKSDVELLQIGYQGTALYAKMLEAIINEEVKNRQRKAEEANRVQQNGTNLTGQQANNTRNSVNNTSAQTGGNPTANTNNQGTNTPTPAPAPNTNQGTSPSTGSGTQTDTNGTTNTNQSSNDSILDIHPTTVDGLSGSYLNNSKTLRLFKRPDGTYDVGVDAFFYNDSGLYENATNDASWNAYLTPILKRNPNGRFEVIKKGTLRPSNTTSSSTGTSTTTQTPSAAPTSGVDVDGGQGIVLGDLEKDKADIDKAVDDAVSKQSQSAANKFVNAQDETKALNATKTLHNDAGNKSIFDEAIAQGVNSEAYNKIIDAIVNELVSTGMDKDLAILVAPNGLKNYLSLLKRKTKSDIYSKLIGEIITTPSKRRAVGMEATTSMMEKNELDKIIDDFIAAYIEEKHLATSNKAKPVIDLVSLFHDIVTDSDLSFDEVRYIYYNMYEYIANSRSQKYKFINKREFNKHYSNPNQFFAEVREHRAIVQQEAQYMHVPTPTSRRNDGKFLTEVAGIPSGTKVSVGYTIGSQGTPVDGSLSITHNGKEIGFLPTVTSDGTNNTFTIKKFRQGFKYEVHKTNNGYTTQFDDLFTGVIEHENVEDQAIWDLLNKIISARADGNYYQVTAEEARTVLTHPIISNLITNGDIVFPTKYNASIRQYENTLVTDSQKANFILDTMKGIIFYSGSAQSVTDMLASYETWNYNLYTNYKNTYDIERMLNDNGKDKKLEIELVNTYVGTAIVNNTAQDINSSELGFAADANPMVGVINDGNNIVIVNEQTGETYTNSNNHYVGTMGLLLKVNNGVPIIAFFTDANDLSSNAELAQDVNTEIVNLLNGFQDGNISFEELYQAFSDLFSGPNAQSNNLFSGYSVIKTGDKIALNINGNYGNQSHQYNLIIYKYKANSNELGTGITYIPNGDVSKAKSSISTDKKFNKAIADEIVKNLKFNRTFFTLRNAKNDNDNSNRYLRKENGKLVVEIGGRRNEYDNFSHFALKNNAFKTNQGKVNGSFFDSRDAGKSIFIDVATKTLPVEGAEPTAAQTITSLKPNEAGDTKQLLTELRASQEEIDVLTGASTGIELLVPKFYYDSSLKANAKYSKGRITFGRPDNYNYKNLNNKSNVIRLLLHESLHAKFDDKKLFDRTEIVDELLETYEQFIDYINNDNSEVGRKLKQWIVNNHFTLEDYFNTLPEENRKAIGDNEKAKRRIFAEEWLVECLTQAPIMNYLNTHNFKGNDVIIDGIDEDKKSLWQKIIDILLKLFNKANVSVKNNTILARQYQILADINNTETTTDNNTNNTPANQLTDDNKSNDTAGEQLLTQNQPEVTEKPTREKTISNQFDEEIEDDELDGDGLIDIDEALSITSSVDDIHINTFNDNPTMSMNGLSRTSNMNDFINQFPVQDRPLVASLVERNEIKFACR